MAFYDFFLRYYNYRPFRSKILNKIVGNLTKKTGFIIRCILPWYFNHSFVNKNRNTSDVIVSFTSFPLRIEYCWLAVECMLRQTVLPQKIVLYLSKEQFDGFDSLPQRLKKYVPEYLVIRWVDGDIKSHKKYWYAIKDFPNERLVIIDDDLIYPSTLLENLLDASIKYPNCVISNYWHEIQWDENGCVLPYSKWNSHKVNYSNCCDCDNIFFGSGGGTLLPSGSLKDADQSFNTLRSCCPLADDIWLNAIVRKNRFKIIGLSYNNGMLSWKIDNNVTLSDINNGKKFNDEQLLLVIKLFEELFDVNPFSRGIYKYKGIY